MKKILSGVLAFAVVLSGSLTFANVKEDLVPISEEEAIEKVISPDAMEFDLEDLGAYYKDDSLMLPLREVAEKLGGSVTWNNERWSAEITGLTPWAEVIIGENRYFFGRIAPFPLSQAPELKDGLTYVPVEFFSKVLKLVYELEGNVLLIGEEAPKLEPVILNAFIKDLDGERNRVLISGDGTSEASSYAWLTEYEDSEIVNEKGEEVAFEDLKVGNRLVVTMPHILALSHPAQGSLEKIVVLEDKSFEIDSIEIKDEEDQPTIKYPLIQGMDEELAEELNQKIEEFVDSIVENDFYKDLELDYEISLVDDNKVSFLFRGVVTPEGFEDEKYLVKSLNLDLETAEEIDFENYFKQDEDSQKELIEKLEEALEERYNIEEFEAEGVFIYFQEGNVVVYYWPLDDSVERPIELYLPITEIDNIINDGF